MLSIGKLATDRAKYYLDQAEGRVDVVESVGDADQLWAVLSGLNPATGVPPRGSRAACGWPVSI